MPDGRRTSDVRTVNVKRYHAEKQGHTMETVYEEDELNHVEDDVDDDALHQHRFENKSDGDKGLRACFEWANSWQDQRHFSQNFSKYFRSEDDTKHYWQARHATSRKKVEFHVSRMTLPAQRKINQFKRCEVFPAYASLFVKKDDTSNNAESMQQRALASNPDYVLAVRQTNDLYNWIKSSMRMLEAMYARRKQLYEDQNVEDPDLLTTYAYKKLEKIDEKWQDNPVSVHSTVLFCVLDYIDSTF